MLLPNNSVQCEIVVILSDRILKFALGTVLIIIQVNDEAINKVEKISFRSFLVFELSFSCTY